MSELKMSQQFLKHRTHPTNRSHHVRRRNFGSGRSHEKIVVHKPRHGRVRLSVHLWFRLHVGVFGGPGIRVGVLGGHRCLLSLQPVRHHVSFPLEETGQTLPGGSEQNRGGSGPTHLHLQHPSALQHVAADLLQQVERAGAALDLQGCKDSEAAS